MGSGGQGHHGYVFCAILHSVSRGVVNLLNNEKVSGKKNWSPGGFTNPYFCNT